MTELWTAADVGRGYASGRPNMPMGKYEYDQAIGRSVEREPDPARMRVYRKALAAWEKAEREAPADNVELSFAGGSSKAGRLVARVRLVSGLWQPRLDRIDAQIAALQRKRRDMILAAFTNGTRPEPRELVELANLRADKRGPNKRAMEQRIDSYWSDVDAATMARASSLGAGGTCGLHGNRPDERCPTCQPRA